MQVSKKCTAIECLDRYLFLSPDVFFFPLRLECQIVPIYDDGVRVRTKIVSLLLRE